MARLGFFSAEVKTCRSSPDLQDVRDSTPTMAVRHWTVHFQATDTPYVKRHSFALPSLMTEQDA